MAAAAIAAAAIPAVLGIIDKLSPSSSTTGASTHTAEQQQIMGQLASGSNRSISNLYGGLNNQVTDPTNTYQGLEDFEGQYQRQVGAPAKAQYEAQLSQLSNSPELFSGGNLSSRMRAQQQFATNDASMRATMMMNERDRQMQASESAESRRMQASGLLSNLSTTALGTKGTENITTANNSWLGTLGSAGSAATSLANSFKGLGDSGTDDSIQSQDLDSL